MGRYNWSGADYPYAIRGYAVSLFFFSTTFLLLQGFLRERRVSQRMEMACSALFSAVFCFPDHWFGLEKWFVHNRSEYIFDWGRDLRIPRPVLEFFPKGVETMGKLPGEFLLFGSVVAVGVASLCFLWKTKKERLLFGSLFFLVVFQTWIHQSMRSPYSYIAHFEGDPNRWWHTVLFINGQGAVNGDYPWFRQAEETFIGIQAPLAPLWDRMFPAFLTSAFSRYIHPYHVGLFLNIFAWFAAVVALHKLSKSVFDEKSARFAALLMASSQGMILYAAQPMIYVFAYATLPILLALYWQFFQIGTPTTSRAILLGLASGLASLSYDLQPWWGVFLLLPIALKKRWKPHLIFVGVSLTVFLFYHNLWQFIPGITYHSALVDPSLSPMKEVVKVIVGFDLLEWAAMTWATVSGWVTFSLRAFMWWFTLALLALWPLRKEREKFRFFILLFLPSFATYAIMQWSRTEYYLQFPRIVFSAFPVVYLLSGKFLEMLSNMGRVYHYVAVGVVVFHIFLMNLDTFGFPYIYMHWFYRGNTLNQIFVHVPNMLP